MVHDGQRATAVTAEDNDSGREQSPGRGARPAEKHHTISVLTARRKLKAIVLAKDVSELMKG
jgi:hypothetical protein